jgi:hypothetical protein
VGDTGCQGLSTSPRALMEHDSPSSPAAGAVDSDARFAPAAPDLCCSNEAVGADALIAAMDAFGAAASAVVSSGGEFDDPALALNCAVPTREELDVAGRRRWRISLALGPAAGTRSSASRWRMRSALICQ